jgi:hypothetical protein
VPLLVADVLEDLARLGTNAGRDALLEAARDTRTDQDGWTDATPVDLAAWLLAERIQRHAVLVRAHLRLGRLPPERPTYEVRGRDPRRVPADRAGALAAALRGVTSAAGSASIDAWLHEEEETGDLHAVLVYAEPVDGAWATAAPACVLRADAFRFRVSEARLTVTTARPQRVDAYAAAWGTALYDDEHFFIEAPSLTLKPLQALGVSGLRAADLGTNVVRARVIACHLDCGDSHRLEWRGPDALAAILPNLRAGGYLTRATLRFDIAGEVRPVDVTLQLPHRIDIGPGGVAASGARGPRLARDALVRLGLLSPGTIPDDVTTLLPLVHPEWRWRELVGEEGVAEMRAAGVLEDVAGETTRRAAVPELRRVGRSAVAFALFRPFEVRGEIDPYAPVHERDLARALVEASKTLGRHTAYYVVPDDWAIPAVTVHREDMAMLRLSLGALLRKARRELGLERGERPKLPRGVLWIGELRVGGGVVRFFYVVRAAPSEDERAVIGRAIAKATAFGRAVVFVPRGRRLARDFVEIELDVREQLGAASWRGRFREAASALSLEEHVPAGLLVAEQVRLVVDAKQPRVALDGVLLTRMGESGYRLVRMLAERRGDAEAVPTRITDKAISGARTSDGATRNVVWKMRAWIAKSFAEAGRTVPDDVRKAGLVRAVGHQGWVLTVSAAIT